MILGLACGPGRPASGVVAAREPTPLAVCGPRPLVVIITPRNVEHGRPCLKVIIVHQPVGRRHDCRRPSTHRWRPRQGCREPARDRTRKRLATRHTPGVPRAACSITLRSAREGTSPSKVTLPVSTAIFTPLGG
jgi:hypothetical protein